MLYYNDGMSFRATSEPDELPDGAVFFEGRPTQEQIAEAFPSYPAMLQEKAKAALSRKVKKELDRRLAIGAQVDLGGGLTFVVQIDEASQDRIGNLSLAATRAQMLAQPFTTPFRDAANVNHDLSATQVISLAEQALARVTALRQASWALKDAAEAPSDDDIVNDANWP